MAKANRKAKKVVIAEAVESMSGAMEQAMSVPAPSVPSNDADFIDEGNMPNGNVAPIDKMPAHVLQTSAAKAEEKHSHIFARKKEGAKRRFQNEYDRVGALLLAAHNEDMKNFEATIKSTAKFNVALTKTQRERIIEMARQKIKSTLNTIFEAWREEMERIVRSMGGMLQEDQSTVLFRDGTTGSFPKGLWIDPAKRITV